MEEKEQEIHLHVKMEKEDVVDMNLIYMKVLKKQKKDKRIFPFMTIWIIGAILVIITITIMAFAGNSPSGSVSTPGAVKHNFNPKFLLPVIFIALYIAVRLLTPILIRKSANKRFDNNKLIQKETEYIFSNEGIQSQSDAITMNWNYNEIFKILETNKFLYLCESIRGVRIIPKRCFASEESLLAVINLLKSKIPVSKYETYQL